MSRNAPEPRHGQASIETLLVFIIFLSAFGIVYAASSRLAAATQSRLDASLSQSTFSEFFAKLQSACSLGSGNVRIVEVKGKPASLAPAGAGGKSIIFSAGSFSAQANSSCEISIASVEAASSFSIENNEGAISISPGKQS
jgi:hypothetical protein